MEEILKNLKYHIYYDRQNKIVYIRDNVKVNHLNEIRMWLICSGYIYDNIIIGINYDGEDKILV